MVAAAATGLGLSAACLPDLADLPPAVVDDGGAPAPSGPVCGNGIIESFDGGAETCDPGDAAAQGCAACRVTCEGTLDPATQHCYFELPAATSFYEARDACLAKGAHLVTINGPDELDRVGALAATYWVGLVADNSLRGYGTQGAFVPDGYEPGVPEPSRGGGSCPGCYTRGKDGGGFDPVDDAGTSSFACVAARDGGWFGATCESVTPAPRTICEREPRGQRSQGCGGAFCFTLPRTPSKSYVLVPSLVTADVARQSCESLSGGRLAVLESADEREELVRELLTITPLDPVRDPGGRLEYWIGLSASDAGAWTWADGTSAASRAVPWGDGEPSATTGAGYVRVWQRKYDTGLVRVETNPVETRPAICERR